MVKINNDTFQLKLWNQQWIDGSKDPKGDPQDTTSHSDISLIINGEEIANQPKPYGEYGINQSAVALLQTVFIDHEPVDDMRPLIYHGCTIMGTCPMCIIDFRVIHISEDEVRLDQFVATEGSNKTQPTRRYDLCVKLSIMTYAKEVLSFAEESFKFLPRRKKGDKFERDMYKNLRNEHSALIRLAKNYLRTGVITTNMKERAYSFDMATCQRR